MKYIKTEGNYEIYEATEPECGEGYKCGHSFFYACRYGKSRPPKLFYSLDAAEVWCMIETWSEEEP